ncbi:hypothetical protein OIU76_000856 [Salix suchowensis]|nr:hypothetical protein OIU76_000856 [Salix suchowensis]
MKKYEFDLQNKVSTEWLTDYSPGLGVSRVPGIGLIYTDIVMGIPAFFSHFITNLPAFHQVLTSSLCASQLETRMIYRESLTSPEGRRMVIVGTPLLEGHALIPTDDTNLASCSTNAASNETLAIPVGDLIRRNAPVRSKKGSFSNSQKAVLDCGYLSGMSSKN